MITTYQFTVELGKFPCDFHTVEIKRKIQSDPKAKKEVQVIGMIQFPVTKNPIEFAFLLRALMENYFRIKKLNDKIILRGRFISENQTMVGIIDMGFFPKYITLVSGDFKLDSYNTVSVES